MGTGKVLVVVGMGMGMVIVMERCGLSRKRFLKCGRKRLSLVHRLLALGCEMIRVKASLSVTKYVPYLLFVWLLLCRPGFWIEIGMVAKLGLT